MSYILDALRRADSERERGAVPGIHAQPVPVLSSENAAPAAAKPWAWMAGGVALALLAAVGWQALSRDDAPREAIGPAPPVAAPATMAAATAPTAPTAPVAPIPSPAPSPAPMAAVTPPALPAAHKATSLVASSPATAPARAPAPANEARIYAQHELPEGIQRELPKLTIGGSIYSDSAASRFLIVNGQIFHENDKVAPDLWLEQIKLKAAVLRYKGYRYGITY